VGLHFHLFWGLLEYIRYLGTIVIVQLICLHTAGYPSAECRMSRCGGCRHEWYDPASGSLLVCSGCVDRRGVQHGEGTSWKTSDCETCTCNVRFWWILSPAYEIGRGILKWRCPSVRPSVCPSVLPSVLPSVRHLRFLSN